MAKNKPEVPYVVYQNENEDSKAYGKWYAELMDRLYHGQHQDRQPEEDVSSLRGGDSGRGHAESVI